MHGEGDVLEHDEGVSDGDASQEEVDWAEMEKPAKYYPPASASLSALILGAKNCHTRIKQYVGSLLLGSRYIWSLLNQLNRS